MGTGSFPVVKFCRGVLLTTYPLLASRFLKSRAIPLLPLWATTGPVTGLLYLTSKNIKCNSIIKSRSVIILRKKLAVSF